MPREDRLTRRTGARFSAPGATPMSTTGHVRASPGRTVQARTRDGLRERFEVGPFEAFVMDR